MPLREIDPARVWPRRGLVLVKPYERPEELASGIILPEVALRDKSWTLWEVVKAWVPQSPEDEEWLAEEVGIEMDLRPDDIISTRPHPPVDSGYVDCQDGRPLLFVQMVNILATRRWKESEHEASTETQEEIAE